MEIIVRNAKQNHHKSVKKTQKEDWVLIVRAVIINVISYLSHVTVTIIFINITIFMPSYSSASPILIVKHPPLFAHPQRLFTAHPPPALRMHAIR